MEAKVADKIRVVHYFDNKLTNKEIPDVKILDLK